MARTIIFAVILFLIVEASFADDYAGTPPPPWHELEELVRQEGFETSPEALIDILKSKSHLSVATYAATVLGLRGDREAIPILADIAKNKKTRQNLREAAAQALGELGEELGFLVLKEMLAESEDLYFQVFLAARLAWLESPDGYGHIQMALFLGSSNIESLAFRELFSFIPLTSKIDSIHTMPKDFILGRLYDQDEWIRRRALLLASLAVKEGLDNGTLRFAVCNMSLADSSDMLRRSAVGTMLSWEPDVLLFCPSIKFRPCWLYDCVR